MTALNLIPKEIYYFPDSISGKQDFINNIGNGRTCPVLPVVRSYYI